MKKTRSTFLLVFSCLITTAIMAQSADDVKMNTFITNLMKRMTIDEKIGQFNLITPGGGIPFGSVVNKNVEAKIQEGKVGALFGLNDVPKKRQAQELNMKVSRLKIPLMFGSDVIHGYKTTFPIPLAMSCSWDMKMIEKSARIAALEASADGLNWTFSPMVDISRDPRWGRVAEGSGEDSYLGSQIAKAMVKGYQQDNLAADTTILACVKHFALYGAPEGGRDYNTVDMSRLTMFEYYLPPYKAAVDAGVGSVMTSFNEVDGIPATGNKWLLTDLLRKKWGFKGFVVTDYTAITEMIDHGIGDTATVAALALKAGSDMEIVGETLVNTIKKSYLEGKVTLKEIEIACRRILEAKYKLGLFDDPYRYLKGQRAAQEMRSADKLQAARNFAARSIVLLKNSEQVLPLKKNGTIALIGPLANDRPNMTGTWTVSGDRQLAVPVLEGMKNVGGANVNILYARGANITDDTALVKRTNMFGARVYIDSIPPDQLILQALETANKADVIVAVVGEGSEFTGESSSRTDITLPESQKRLLAALKGTGKPLIVLMMSGRPLALEWENDIATALLQTWHLGHEAGNAIADVLFGHYNPSGKLTMSFPRNVGQIPIYYNHKNTGRPQAAGPAQKFRSNYLDAPNTPLFSFGYGLSYTTFVYSDISLNTQTMQSGEKIQAKITITNNGQYDGEEIVQLYIHDVYASVAQPLKKLKAFQKVFIKKGESKEVVFDITEEQLKFFNSDLQWVSEPGDFRLYIGTSSDNVKRADFTLVKASKK